MVCEILIKVFINVSLSKYISIWRAYRDKYTVMTPTSSLRSTHRHTFTHARTHTHIYLLCPWRDVGLPEVIRLRLLLAVQQQLKYLDWLYYTCLEGGKKKTMCVCLYECVCLCSLYEVCAFLQAPTMCLCGRLVCKGLCYVCICTPLNLFSEDLLRARWCVRARACVRCLCPGVCALSPASTPLFWHRSDLSDKP